MTLNRFVTIYDFGWNKQYNLKFLKREKNENNWNENNWKTIVK